MPEWASVKPQWQPEQLGWFDADDALVAVALVLHRALPALKKTLAYIPDGPIWDWDAHRAPAVLEPLREHLKEQGAFLVRMGPPVIQKRFPADQIRKALSQDTGGDMTGETLILRASFSLTTSRRPSSVTAAAMTASRVLA